MGESHSIQKYFFSAILLHIILLTTLIVSFNASHKNFTWRNADDDHLVIHATVLTISHAKISQPKLVKPIVKAQQKNNEAATLALAIKKDQKILLAKKQKVQKLKQAKLKQEKLQQEKLKQEKLQQAFAKELKELNAKSLQQQVLIEQKKLHEAKDAAMRGEVNKYKALILQTIADHWLVPPNTNKKIFAELLIRLAPGGLVLDVQLIKSSGVDALDRSARAAVFKASPLPVPKEAEAFDAFRQFILRVKPENILENTMG